MVNLLKYYLSIFYTKRYKIFATIFELKSLGNVSFSRLFSFIFLSLHYGTIQYKNKKY